MSDEGRWMITYSGEIVYPYDLEKDQVNIVDIAHALSRTCRYSGHCEGYYSVAQHSTLVAKLAPDQYKLTALLHDSPEAYLRDLPRPVKRQLKGYNDLEESVWSVIAEKYSLPQKIPSIVKKIDRAIVKAELRDVMGQDEDMFGIEYDTPDIQIERKTMEEVKLNFIEMFLELTEK